MHPMAETSNPLAVKEESGVTVATLMDPKILDELNIANIGNQLTGMVSGRRVPRLVLDFANVTNMSSSALGMLITLHKRVREAEGKLRLCNIQPTIEEVFKITRLDEIFTICPNRSQAVRSAAE
jgi:anti-sigma B factor antagonist